MKIYSLRIRRDANTMTPIEVPEHEVPILQSIYGEESIHNIDGKRIDEVGLAGADVVADVERDPSTEFDRLAARYGGNDDGLIVEQIYGKKAARGLEARIAAIAAEDAKRAAANDGPEAGTDPKAATGRKK